MKFLTLRHWVHARGSIGYSVRATQAAVENHLTLEQPDFDLAVAKLGSVKVITTVYFSTRHHCTQCTVS
jgi:hypothetical protein